MGMKMVSVRANSPEKYNKGAVIATTMLLNFITGEVSAILAAKYLTGARTAAGSALATEMVLSNRKTSDGLTFGVWCRSPGRVSYRIHSARCQH